MGAAERGAFCPIMRYYCQQLLLILFCFRHWQELGFLIIYVTSRLDFQKIKVMSWLAEHNFPYGLVSFCSGISKDIQRHKTEFLRYLVNDVSNRPEWNEANVVTTVLMIMMISMMMMMMMMIVIIMTRPLIKSNQGKSMYVRFWLVGKSGELGEKPIGKQSRKTNSIHS